MKNVHDEKEKLMAQFFGNSRTLDINETMKTLDSIDSELNRLIEKNNSDIREMSSFDADSLKKTVMKTCSIIMNTTRGNYLLLTKRML